jgi:purine-cytosine permease-like protein
LRTMALARFAGGWPGAFIFSLLNILTQLAYSVTVALAGAQALHSSMLSILDLCCTNHAHLVCRSQ